MMLSLRPALAALCLPLAGSAFGATEVEVCYDYGCLHHAQVRFSESQVEELRELLASATDARDERLRVSQAIGRMYAIAGAQSPIHRDRGRNPVEERGLVGAMDCVDHSSNTQAFLGVLKDAGALRYHRPGSREIRFAFLMFGEHWAATIVEEASQKAYAVDSWFFDPGTPAVVVKLSRWKAGYDPGQDAARRP